MSKDIIGQDIVVGNYVAFNPPKFSGLTTGKVIKLTPKGVSVEYVNNYNQAAKCNRAYGDVIKVDEQIAFMAKMRGDL